MKHILAPILLLVFLFPSLALGEEDANKITSNTNNILEQIANETDGKSVLEFNRFSSYEEISRTYQCEEYKPKDNPRLINSTGDWITHICTKKDIKLLLQVQKNGGI